MLIVMNTRSITAAVMLAALTLTACDTIKTSDTDIKRIEYDEVRKLLGNAREPAVLLDARPRRHYDAEHLPDALHIPLPELVSRDERLTPYRHVIVYGTDYRDPISPAAAKTLMRHGYKSVFDFRGGVAAWKDAGGATVTPGGGADGAKSP